MSWFSRQRREEDLDRELKSHLELEAEDQREAGLPAEEARFAARRNFGNVAYTKEEVRHMWGWTQLEAMLQDFRFAARGLRKYPGFALTAILTLALGIGASTAVFTVVASVLLKPLSYRESNRLVVAWEHVKSIGGGPVGPNPRHADVWARRSDAFSGMTAFTSGKAGAAVGSESPRIVGSVVCQPNLFQILQASPVLGRDFLPDEGRSGGRAVTILTFTGWQNLFQGDRGVIGRVIRVNDAPHEVVGVLPESFRFPNANTLRSFNGGQPKSGIPEPWMFFPIRFDYDRIPWNGEYGNWVTLARLAPGATIGSASAQLNGIQDQLWREMPGDRDTTHGAFRASLQPMQEALVSDSSSAIWLLMAAVAGLMLIACLNLANAQLGRALTHRRDASVRAALGATRWRLMWSALAENLMLALIGGALGVLLAFVGLSMFRRYSPIDIPRLAEIRLDLTMLLFYPKPNNLSTANKGFNFSSQIPDSYPRRESLIRGDYNLSSRWKIYSHYLHNKDGVTSAYGSFVLGSGFPIVPITDIRPGYNYSTTATAILSATMTNETTFGIAHNQINIDAVNSGLTRAKTGINIPLLFPSAAQQDYIPRFSYAGSRIGNEQRVGTNNAPFYNYNTTLHWIDNFSKIWNAHVIKAGVYIERSRKDQTSFANSSGEINFGDNNSNPFDTGFGFANMAVGSYTTFNQASGYFTGKYRYTNAEWYMQDQWKVTRRLTLDYGMRFEWIQPQFDAAELTSTFLPERFDANKAPRLYRPTGTPSDRSAIDPATGQTLPATAIGKIVPNSGNLLNGIAKAGTDISKYLIRNRGVNYSPRLGFAYDITGRQQFVLRGGGAIFYDRFQGNEVFDMLTNPPTTFAPTLVNGFLKDTDPKNILIGPSGLNAFDYNGQVPTVFSFSLGVQTKLPLAMVLDTSYVGLQSRHQLQRINLNAVPYGAAFRPENQDPTKNSATRGSSTLDADFLRPYRGYGDITLHKFDGNDNYNSLQVSLNRRFTKGLFFGFNWTWSRALGLTSDRGQFVRIDNLERFANYRPLDFDRHHTVNIFYSYELPDFFRSRRLAHAIADGWQITGNTFFQSGNPYDISFSIPGIDNRQNITGSYTESARIRLIGNPLQGTSDNPYNRINPAAFMLPAIGSIGLDSPFRYLRGPGINNNNLSLQKSFAIREGMRLEPRADAFNIFNHPQFGGVGGNGTVNNNGINATINYRSLTDPTPTNLYLNPNGTVNDKNGFGTVSGARDPRIMQLVVRFRF